MSPDRIYRELALRVYEMASREAERHMLVGLRRSLASY